MHKRAIIFIYVLIFGLFTQVDAAAVQPGQQKGSLMAKIEEMGGAEFEFTLEITTSNSRKAPKQRGSAEVQGGCWHVMIPSNDFYCDGTTMWVYTPQTAEVVVSGVEQLPMLYDSVTATDNNGHLVAEYDYADGTHFKVVIDKITPLKETMPKSSFRFNPDGIADLIVTDLR